MSAILSELKRRNVLRVAALYLVGAWLVAQVIGVATGAIGAALMRRVIAVPGRCR